MNQEGITEADLFINKNMWLLQAAYRQDVICRVPTNGAFSEWNKRDVHRCAMMVRFFDLEQENDNPFNGAEAVSREQLTRILEHSHQRYPRPFVARLEGWNGEELALGVGDPGFVEFQSSNSIAVRPGCDADPSKQPSGSPPNPEFLCGGTASPIPWEHSIPFELVKRVAVDFLETGERSKAVEWYG
jgi:hypothetical protein